jgi:PleD family two-component response regulator
LPNISPEALTHTVTRLLEAVRVAHPLADVPRLTYTASAGVVMLDSIKEPAENMQRADHALYVAKARGRDQLVWAAD